MTVPIISCPFCIHFQGPGPGADPICTAFPEGIPDPISYGRNHHTEPYPGDGGIRFEAIDGLDPDFLQLFEDLDEERVTDESRLRESPAEET